MQPLLRDAAAPGHVQGGARAVNLRPAERGQGGRVHHVVVVGVGDEDGPQAVDPVQADQLLRQGPVRLPLAEEVAGQGGPGQVGVKEDLVPAVVEEQGRGAEIGDFHRLHLP